MLVAEWSSKLPLLVQVEGTLEDRTVSFTDDIENSIGVLRTKATELDAESKNPMLFDGKTEMVEALSLLAKLSDSFQQLKADSTRFAEYQDILKVPITKYEEVEDLEINLRLKRNLWQVRLAAPAHSRAHRLPTAA